MSGIVIHPADPQGADALGLLHEASIDARALYPEAFAGITAAATNGPLVAGGVYLVGTVDGRPVACGALHPLGDAVAEVRRMYVHREHRRRGFARAVLSRLVDEAARLGYRRLLLETGDRQQPAMALYEASGFVRIAPFGNHVDDPTSVCYERRLG